MLADEKKQKKETEGIDPEEEAAEQTAKIVKKTEDPEPKAEEKE